MQRRKRSRGFVLVTMMASSVVLLTLVGLSIDTGHLHLTKVRMQTAADAGAIGAVQARKSDAAASATAAARASTAANGFTHGQNSTSVTVNSPPSTGYYTADQAAVEVVIRQTVNTFFMGLAGFHTMDVAARAVAHRAPGPNCVYVLDPGASPAISASGGAIVTMSCGVMVNSSANTALSVSGGARVAATSVNIVGGYSASGGGSVSPAPSTHVSPESDPLADVPAPAVGPCTRTGFSLSSGGVLTLPEGVYCGGISVSGGARLTLSGGTYVLKGGGLTVSGNSYLRGDGVTFYNTFGGGYSYGAISLSGQATVTLSAPTGGPTGGILFFQDRALASNIPSAISGGANSRFDGALYFPTTSLSYSGGTGTDYTIIVAKTLSFSGGTVVNSDYSSLASGTPVKAGAALGE